MIKNKKNRFIIKKFLFNIYFFFYNLLPNRKLSNYFFYTKSDKYYNYPELYNTINQFVGKNKKNTILEIGIGGHDLDYEGGNSLLGLSYYFKNSKIFGMDLIDKSFLNSSRIKTLIGSQNNIKTLNRFGKKFGPFDLIIDDGSHFANHQITSFENLFKYLKDGGLYIIEDLGGSYKKSSNGDPLLSSKNNVVEYFSRLVHSTNSHRLIKKIKTKLKFIDISNIYFFKNAILIIKKIKMNEKSFDNKLAFQKLSLLNKNRKIITLHKKKIKPFKTKEGLIKFTSKD